MWLQEFCRTGTCCISGMERALCGSSLTLGQESSLRLQHRNCSLHLKHQPSRSYNTSRVLIWHDNGNSVYFWVLAIFFCWFDPGRTWRHYLDTGLMEGNVHLGDSEVLARHCVGVKTMITGVRSMCAVFQVQSRRLQVRKAVKFLCNDLYYRNPG